MHNRTVNLPHQHLTPQLELTPFDFCRHFGRQKARIPVLSYGVVYVILRLAVLVEHRLVTDGRTEGHTTTANISALAIVAKTAEPIEMPFGLWARVGSKTCIRWGPDRLMRRSNFFGESTCPAMLDDILL